MSALSSHAITLFITLLLHVDAVGKHTAAIWLILFAVFPLVVVVCILRSFLARICTRLRICLCRGLSKYEIKDQKSDRTAPVREVPSCENEDDACADEIVTYETIDDETIDMRKSTLAGDTNDDDRESDASLTRPRL